ncbi:glycosyltransferase family 4 protein [Haloferula sargassicola]|uniref:D-inositol-3-phosphate glycosyltransferase n=1 Tax=Haloferula sargassicola TaxID=490096 RepID=A0ABP9UTG0_9BACT
MKVLQVLPEMHAGGVERGTLELATHLTAHGHESLVLSGGGRQVPKLEAGGTRHLTLPVGKKSPATLLLVPELRRLLVSERPDILHLRSRVPAWAMWLAWRKLPESERPRLVTTVHGFYSVSRWSAIMTCGERVICVSDSIRDYVLQNYPKTPADRLRVVPRGVDPADYPFGFRPDGAWCEAFHAEFPETRDKRLITLPGRITRLKGHEDLATILAGLGDLTDVHAVVVGGVHPKKQAYAEEVRQRFHDAGLDDRVTFTGNRDDLRNILAISTLVLSLTRQPESFGRTTLEALAMGVPVTGYSHGGVAEQLEELFPEGKLTPNQPEAAVPVIRGLLQKAPPVAQPNPFTLKRMLEGTIEVYRELMG